VISVVIPARNEAATLGETLDYLASCTPPGAGEVVRCVRYIQVSAEDYRFSVW